MRKFLMAAAIAVGAWVATPAQAGLTVVGPLPGNDCGGQGGFPNCYATTQGTQQGFVEGSTPAIFKQNSVDNQPTGSVDFGIFASIDGSEFAISYNTTTHVLSFTYTPGLNDPQIHAFTIKQANSFYLFYDFLNPITSGAIDLDDYFPGNVGWSHITFFDTGGNSGFNPISEPLSLGLFGAGLLGLGFVRRRRSA